MREGRLRATGRLRLAARVTALAGWLAACLVAHGAASLFGRGRLVPPVFLGGAARICRVRWQIVGEPASEGALFLANHVSWLDILALAGATGTTFVAKGDLRAAPVVGWLASLHRTVFVERDARMTIAQQVAAFRHALATERFLTLFPEGTTGDGHRLLPFKSAMLSVLDGRKGGAMVQPVLLDYGPATDEIAWIGEESGLGNARRILAGAGAIPLTIHVLEPLGAGELCDRKRAAAAAHRQLSDRLARLRGAAATER